MSGFDEAVGCHKRSSVLRLWSSHAHRAELTPLYGLPRLMQGLSSIIFISASFFKQPDTDDF